MAEDYSVNLKAQLDTTDVQNKLQQLGNTGGNSITQLETAISNLNGSIQQLGKSWHNVAEQQKQAATNMTQMLRGAGAALAGQVIQAGGKLAAATGHENLATGAGFAGAALKGAGAGAAVGSVVPVIGTTVGAAIGAAAGLASKALDNLATSAEKTAKVMEDIARLEGVNADLFEQEAMRRQIEERVPKMSAEDLKSRREFLSQDVQEYHDFLMMNHNKLGEAKRWGFNWDGRNGWTVGPAGGKLSEYELEQAKLLLEQTRTLKQQADTAQKEIDAINKELESRDAVVKAQKELEAAKKREAEVAKKQAEAKEAAEEKIQAAQREAVTKSAASALSSFQRQQRLHAFGEGLQDLTPAELQNMKNNLVEQNSALAGRVTDLFAYAQTTGSAADLEAAQNALSEFNEGSSMLKMVEGLLGGISEAGEGGLQSPLQSLQALYSEAQKGYDVGGYGSIDQEMLKVEQETKDAAKESATTLRNIHTKLDEVKNAITSGNSGSKWG